MERKSHQYWMDVDNILKVSKKYKTRNEFRVNDKRAYDAASRYGFLDIVCSHMVKPVSSSLIWTEEKCREVLSTCKDGSELKKKEGGAYNAAIKFGLLEEYYGEYKRPTYWTKKRCHQAALECKTKFEFYTEYNTAYQTATQHSWLKDISSHLKVSTSVKHPSKY